MERRRGREGEVYRKMERIRKAVGDDGGEEGKGKEREREREREGEREREKHGKPPT